MLALPIFPGRPSIVPPWKLSGGLFQADRTISDKKRARHMSGSTLCWHYLSSRVGQRIVLP